MDWYTRVLGAEVTFDPIVMPDNRIGHISGTRSTTGGSSTSETDDLPAAQPQDQGVTGRFCSTPSTLRSTRSVKKATRSRTGTASWSGST